MKINIVFQRTYHANRSTYFYCTPNIQMFILNLVTVRKVIAATFLKKILSLLYYMYMHMYIHLYKHIYEQITACFIKNPCHPTQQTLAEFSFKLQ